MIATVSCLQLVRENEDLIHCSNILELVLNSSSYTGVKSYVRLWGDGQLDLLRPQWM